MEDIKFTYREVITALIVFNVLMGVLFGSLPLIAGLKLKRQRLAWIGFALALVLGTVLGVVAAYIVAVIFLWLILRQSATTPGEVASAESAPETPEA
jgi:phosphotransferase system  glucose/maltose/N-acetylglucosamine-specific IIC component